MEDKVKRNMYDIQNSILKKDFIPTDDELKMLNSFLVCRWLSNHPFSIEVANYINSHYTLPIKAQYWLARSFVNGVKFIGQAKKEKEDTEKIEAISKEYICNNNLAKRYIEILPDEEIERILSKWNSHGRIKETKGSK